MTDREKLVELCKTACRRGRDCSKSCYECVADHLIENGVTVQNWIPVTERLPEEFVSVLVYIPSYTPMPTVREAYHVDDCWATKIVIFHDDNVTHWMPLPEPPKEEA